MFRNSKRRVQERTVIREGGVELGKDLLALGIFIGLRAIEKSFAAFFTVDSLELLLQDSESVLLEEE